MTYHERNELIEEVLQLKKQGLNNCQIARKVDRPLSTIRGWLSGKVKNARHANNHTVSDEDFIRYVKESFSIAEVIRKCWGNSLNGGYYQMFHKRVAELKLDTSHFTGQAHLKGKTHNWGITVPNEEIFVENSTTSRNVVRRKVIAQKLIPYKCSCGNKGKHLGKPLSLHLDHINGVRNDHRLENLRFLCPNCHSQTKTYAGKNIKK